MAAAAVADREKTDSLQSYYDEHGYVVVRSLIPEERIARLLAVYTRDIVPSQQRFFRQNSSRYERNRINDHGYVRQSFLDIHDYQSFPEFSAAARDIFCSNEMMETISAVTGAPRHNLMQTMLFDLNTATWPHQDWYYLDSVPNGSLIAAWIALEDIREEAGRFYVMPGSHELGDFGARSRASRSSGGSSASAITSSSIAHTNSRRRCAAATCCCGTRAPCMGRSRPVTSGTPGNRSPRTTSRRTWASATSLRPGAGSTCVTRNTPECGSTAISRSTRCSTTWFTQ